MEQCGGGGGGTDDVAGWVVGAVGGKDVTFLPKSALNSSGATLRFVTRRHSYSPSVRRRWRGGVRGTRGWVAVALENVVSAVEGRY